MPKGQEYIKATRVFMWKQKAYIFILQECKEQ